MVEKIKKLLSHKGFQKYAQNISWLFAERILRMTVGLWVGLWVTRYLGPEKFGIFSYARSFAGLFTVVATLGLDSIVIRELVKDEQKRDLLLGTAFTLKLIAAIVVLFVLVVATSFTSNDKFTNIIIIIIASSTIFRSLNVIDFYFQSKVLSKYAVYANTITFFISSILKILFIVNRLPLIAFVWIVLFDSIVLAMGYLYFYFKNNLSISKWKSNKLIALNLLRDSWPLVMSSIVVTIYMKIDQVMIKEMLDLEAVGQYAAAVRLSEFWYFIPVLISSSLFPAIINAKKKSEKLYYKRLQRLFDFMVWGSIAIMLPIAFLSNFIVKTLYGEAYYQAGSVLRIHIWAGVFVFLGVASGKWLVSENLMMLSFWRTFAGMIVNVIANILLIPKYDIKGAAIATLLSYMVAGFLFDLFNKKTRQMFYMKLKTMNVGRLLW